jgi:DNA gyrase inhibitor GyrI
MKELSINMATLPAYRVACFSGFGPEPEMIAWGKLVEWSQKHDMLPLKPETRIFGFNNPDPSPGSPNYGYNFWITLPEKLLVDDAEILNYPGGYYAITPCAKVENIFGTWQQFNKWLEQSPYVYGKHQWLEEVFLNDNNPEEFDHFDLFLPLHKE